MRNIHSPSPPYHPVMHFIPPPSLSPSLRPPYPFSSSSFPLPTSPSNRPDFPPHFHPHFPPPFHPLPHPSYLYPTPISHDRIPPSSPTPSPNVPLTTFPTTSYLLLKNVNHSSSTVFSFSSRSCHSGTQSSGFRDEVARARLGSLPAKTVIT